MLIRCSAGFVSVAVVAFAINTRGSTNSGENFAKGSSESNSTSSYSIIKDTEVAIFMFEYMRKIASSRGGSTFGVHKAEGLFVPPFVAFENRSSA